MSKRAFAIGLALLLSTLTAYAHIGSPDVYAEGQAGPYKLSVVVRPPLVIPGVADIKVRAETPDRKSTRLTPVT